MSAQKKTGGFLSKIGPDLAKAHEEHKNDETTYSNFGDLPAGVENGIAQLKVCKFGTYEKGDMKDQVYFMASGVVVHPKEHEGIPIEGLRTMIMEPICSTPSRTRKTVSDHVAWVYNELRKLGLDTSKLNSNDVETAVEALQQAAPYFRFRTYKIPKRKKGDKDYNEKYDGPDAPEPKTNHTWNGYVDYNDTAADDPGVHVSDSSSVGQAPPDVEPASNDDQQGEAAASGDASGGDHLRSLAAAASSGDEDAQAELTKAALAAGMSQDDVNDAPSWDDIVDRIQASDTPQEPSETADPANPQVGNVFHYCPIDPKTKKPMRKSVEVEITKVDPKTKTVTLKNLDNTKLNYQAVKWGALLTEGTGTV